MAGVTIGYKGETIATIQGTGSKTIKTQGKYCEGDITVDYVKEGITPTGAKNISTNGTHDVTQYASANVNVSGFEADITFNAVNDTAQAYLTASAAYDTPGYTDTVADDYASTTTRHDLPLSYSLTAPAGAAKFSIFDKESGAWLTQDVTGGGTVTVKNLIPNRFYCYFFVNSSGALLSGGNIKATGALRMIDANSANGIGVFNIRDIGGRSCDGGTLKYGKIYRGSQFNSIYSFDVPDAAQKAMMKDFLGVRDDIDLRSASETAGQDRDPGTADDFVDSPLGKDVDYINIRVSPYSTGVNLSNAAQTALYFALINRIISDAVDGKPCYVHCAEGADRTATILALIEALCGVSKTDVERGYELTSLAQNRARYRTSSEWTGLMTYINSLSGDSFRDKVLYYALNAGVALADINAMRHALIDGNPADIVNPFTTIYTITSTTSAHTHNSNSDTTIFEGSSYTANITADTDYNANVVVTMGGVDITSTAYSNGVISIASVTGNLVITVTEIYIGNLFDPSAATLNARIKSNGTTASDAVVQGHQLVTDFIPISPTDKLRVVTDRSNTDNIYMGNIALYNSSKTYVAQYVAGSPIWSWNSDYTDGTADVSINTVSPSTVAYCRFCLAYDNTSNIEIKMTT